MNSPPPISKYEDVTMNPYLSSGSPSPPPPHAIALPDTMISLIMSYLSSANLSTLSRVNHEWHAVTREPWLWKQWFMTKWPATRLGEVDTDVGDASPTTDPDGLDADDLNENSSQFGADRLHQLNEDCAGAVQWQTAYHARSDIAAWSAQLFTPPKRRARQSSADKPHVEFPPQSSSPGPSPSQHTSGRSMSRNNNHERSHNSREAAERKHEDERADRRGSGGGGIVRSKSTSWSEEKRANARRYSSEETPETEYNNFSPIPAPRVHTGTHANNHLRAPKHAQGSHGSPIDRKRTTRAPAGSASKSPALPPAFPTNNGASTSPKLTGASSSLWNSMDELDLSDPTDASLPLILTGHKAAVTCLRFDDTRLALASGRDVRVHSLRSGSLLGSIRVIPNSATTHGLVTGVDFGSRVLVASGTDCALRTFDMDSMTLQRVSAKKHAHQDVITALHLSSNERGITSISLDGTLKIFDVEEGSCISTINANTDATRLGMLLCMDFISESELICGSSFENQAKVGVFDLRQSKLTQSMSILDNTSGGAPTQMVCSVSYSPSNYGLAVGGNDGSVQLYDIRQLSQQPPPVIVTVPPLNMAPIRPSSRSGSPGPTQVTNVPTLSPPPPSNPSSSTAQWPSASTTSSSTVAASSTLASSSVPVSPTSPFNIDSIQGEYRAGPPVLSLHLDSARLLVCQKRVFSIYSSTASTPAVSTGLPFAHLIHRVSLDDASRWSKPVSGPSQFFHFMRYDDRRGVLALASTDSVLVSSNTQQ